MIRMSTGKKLSKYRVGIWSWNEELEQLAFDSHYEDIMAKQKYIKTGGFKFLKFINLVEELIYRQEFQRDDNTFDADVILIQDIVNLVLFLAPKEIVTKKFVCFLNTRTVHAFLHALIIYFEHFLKVVEFLLIRRDEITGNMPRMQSLESNQIKQIFSIHLMQYRLLLAREYSKILLGEGSMKSFHHYIQELHLSKTLSDRAFHECFLAFCTQVVWIAMHRRAFDVIEMEMARLFRSEHFILHLQDFIQFTEAERKVLYGKNYKRVNYRIQNSPVVQEITNVSKTDLPILWIGEHKYSGTDMRIHELEMEFLVPSSQLVLINMVHGILGHPKKIYNTLLQLNWSAVRKLNFNEDYDPYNIVKQPRLTIPKLNEEAIRKHAKEYKANFKIIQLQERWGKTMIQKWANRDSVVKHYKTKGMLTDILVKCTIVLEEEKLKPNIDQITKQFIERKGKLQKKF